MPKLTADYSACQGYGNCAVSAADTFDVDDDGVVMLLRDTIGEAERARIDEAVRSCPVDALRIERDR